MNLELAPGVNIYSNERHEVRWLCNEDARIFPNASEKYAIVTSMDATKPTSGIAAKNKLIDIDGLSGRAA